LLALLVLKPLTIDFEEMQIAFEDEAGEGDWFLDVETGDAIRLREDGDELGEQVKDGLGARYIEIPCQASQAGDRDMAEFINSVNDNRLRALLDMAIQGKGASRRFKDVLREFPDELERWFAFQKGCAESRIRRWLRSIGMEPVARAGSGN
jgi:hypothetical protein